MRKFALAFNPMDVTIFKHLHSAKPQRTPLEKIVQMIRTSPLLQEYTEEARRHYAAGEKDKGDSIKKNLLPAFAPAGYLLDSKGRASLIGPTGLCFVDIDHIETQQVDASMAHPMNTYCWPPGPSPARASISLFHTPCGAKIPHHRCRQHPAR